MRTMLEQRTSQFIKDRWRFLRIRREREMLRQQSESRSEAKRKKDASLIS
jgi:hypothetical protein